MGIFKWIMSLFKRRKRKARAYDPSKRINSNEERKEEYRIGSDVTEPFIHVENEPPRVIVEEIPQVLAQETTQPKRRRRRQQVVELVPTDDEEAQIGLQTLENSDAIAERKRLDNTEPLGQKIEVAECTAVESELDQETECIEKEETTVESETLKETIVGSDEKEIAQEEEVLPEVTETETPEDEEVSEAVEELEAIEESCAVELPEPGDIDVLEDVKESIELEKIEENSDTEGESENYEEEQNVSEPDEITADEIKEEPIAEEYEEKRDTSESDISEAETFEEEPEMGEAEDQESDAQECALPEESDTEESEEIVEAAIEEENAENEIETDEVSFDEHEAACESPEAIEEKKIDLVAAEEDDADDVVVEPEEKAVEEKADKKERKVIKGNLYQEKKNVQRRVISEEEQLRKYILEQFYVQPLLGSIDVSRTEFEYVLMPWFKNRARYALYGTNALGGIDPVFCVCLVQIAMRDSKHGEFWNHVAKRLGYSKPTQTMTSRFGEIFIKTMKAHKKIVFDSGEKVASILMHCFVCDNHIPKLFDFLYAYYELDLFRHLEMADVRKLRDIMVSGKYYTRKQYILQQTVDVLTHLPELAIERFERYLTWIDKAYFDASYEPESVGRFAEAFKKWKSKHPDFSAEAQEKELSSRKGQKMFSSPELHLNLKNGRFSVVFPKQRIPFECNDAYWEVITSDVKRVECEVIEAITSNLADEVRSSFPSTDLLGSIQFRLMSGTSVLRIFEIEKDCCRAFDEDGCLIKNRHLTSGTVYCFTHKGEQLKTEAPCTQQLTDDWLMSCYTFEAGMTIDFPDSTFAIVGGELGEGVCGSTPIQGALIYDQNRRPMPVYGRMPMIMIKTAHEKFLSGRMSLNTQYYSLEKLEYRKVELGNRSDEFGFLVTIPDKRHLIYDISIDIASEHDVRKYRFAYMDGFGIRFENSGEPLPYLFAPRGSVTLFGNPPLHGRNMEKHPRKSEFGFVLNAEQQVLEFDVLGHNALLELEIPVVAYRFDQQEWRIQSPGEMWHTELPEKIEFRIPGTSLELSVDADADTGKQSVVYSRGQNEKTIICDLMQLRSWLGREMFRHDIDLVIDGNRRHFAAVYARSAVFSARLECDFENDVLRGVFDIVGKSRYVVSLFYGEKLIAEQIPVENGEIKVEMPADVGLYKAVIYEVEEDEFGFGEQLYKIGEAECELIDPGNIEGKTFHIKNLLTLDRREEILPIRHKRYWIDVLAQKEERRYFGRMRVVDLWGAADPIPVVITLRKKTMIDQVQIAFIDDGEEQPFLYDYATKAIVRNEDMTLHRMERYRRYTMLDHEDLFSVIYM